MLGINDMLFSSALFLVYVLPVFITGYILLPKTVRNGYLLLLSLLFYWWGEPWFVFFVLGFSIINFFVAQKIPTSNKPRSWLFLYILINLGQLVYFKYSNFFIENINELLFSLGFSSIEWTKIALPIGISFFTFQSITYGVDVYRKDAVPQKSILNYLLYILFFPQLIAGPIVTYKSIAKQISERSLSKQGILEGFSRFSVGLAKKVLIANVVAEFSKLLVETDAFFPPDSTYIAWMTAICYTIEIYFDFSGYSDMAIGLGKMVGFTFPENFDRPYLSKSITEFWRRWHITLGNFMKNYLYIPLGGNKGTVNRTYINLLTVFFLSGLWHGASWNFVAWGLFHGFWLVIERIIKFDTPPFLLPFRIIFTFIIVLHGWVMFDATTFQEGWNHLEAMYSFKNFDFLEHKNLFYYQIHVVIALVIILLGYIPQLNQLFYRPNYNCTGIQLYTKFGFYMLLFLLAFIHVLAGGFNPFIYFQF